MDPVRKLGQIGLLFTRARSGTSLEQIQMDPKLDPILGPFRSLPDRFQTALIVNTCIQLFKAGLS